MYLEDCKHTIENDGLLQWMNISTEESEHPQPLRLKRCPKCSTPIKKCMRVMNQIKICQKDLVRAKEKILFKDRKNSNFHDFNLRQRNLVEHLKELRKHDLVKGITYFEYILYL